MSPGSPPCSSRFLTNVKVMISSGFAAWPAALARDLREGWYRLFCLCRDRVPQHSGILNITSAGRRVQADSVLGSSWPALCACADQTRQSLGLRLGLLRSGDQPCRAGAAAHPLFPNELKGQLVFFVKRTIPKKPRKRVLSKFKFYNGNIGENKLHDGETTAAVNADLLDTTPAWRDV